MSLMINAISAVGNNSSVYPLIVRDCVIEGPIKVAQNYNETAKESKRMGWHCLREKTIDEFGTSAIWIGGVPFVEAIANKIMKKTTGFNGKVNLKLLEKTKDGKGFKNPAQNIDINIKKFAKLAPEAVQDLINVKNNTAKYKKLSNQKYSAALILPMIAMGYVLPKLNYGLTNILIERDIKNGKLKSRKPQQAPQINVSNITAQNSNFKSLNSMRASSNPNFKGLGSTIATLSHTNKMAITDGGLAVGRVYTSRGKYEKIESAFNSIGMLVLNFGTPEYIDKGLNKITKSLFKINTALDPKIMADKRFLVKVRSNKLILPKKEEEVLDFIDNNPKSLLAKYARKNKIVKFLDNGVRDPREVVDTKKLFSLSENMRVFAAEAKKSNLGIAKYAKTAIKAKSFNIAANVAISSMLLAVGLPQAQFVLRRIMTGSNIAPGLVVTKKKEQRNIDRGVGVNKLG